MKWQVNSSSNFGFFFIVMTHNSSANFKVIPFLLWTKGSHQSSNFDAFKCSGENVPNFSSLFSNHKSVFLQNLHISTVSWKITPLYFCSSNNRYFSHKEPIKTNFLDFRELGSKFVKFLMSILKRRVSSCSIFVSFFNAMTHNSSVNFKVMHFLLRAKGSHQSSNFDTFECSGENLPNSSCHFSSNKLVYLQILHHFQTTPYFFSSNIIYFTENEHIKVKISETFECSFCQFWNDKSIPLQILDSSLFSWKITPLYFFSSNNIYFSQKEPIKMNIFETFKCSGQNPPDSLYNFEMTGQFLCKFCAILHCHDR